MDESQTLDLDRTIRLAKYLEAHTEWKEQKKQILQENEDAIAPIVESFYGEYMVYQINYVALAFEENTEGEDDYDLDFGFGLKGKKAKIENYDAYCLTDKPDDEGYYKCFDRFGRWGDDLYRVKFQRVAYIAERKVILSESRDSNNGSWIFPRVEINYANAGRYGGGGSSASFHVPPGTDIRALAKKINASLKPLPVEPSYGDFGITDNEYRALRASL